MARPRSSKGTKASKIRNLLAKGRKIPTIAKMVDTSKSYVHRLKREAA